MNKHIHTYICICIGWEQASVPGALGRRRVAADPLGPGRQAGLDNKTYIDVCHCLRFYGEKCMAFLHLKKSAT